MPPLEAALQVVLYHVAEISRVEPLAAAWTLLTRLPSLVRERAAGLVGFKRLVVHRQSSSTIEASAFSHLGSVDCCPRKDAYGARNDVRAQSY